MKTMSSLEHLFVTHSPSVRLECPMQTPDRVNEMVGSEAMVLNRYTTGAIKKVQLSEMVSFTSAALAFEGPTNDSMC